LITLSSIKRRIVYVSLFEVTAILFSTFILMLLNDGDSQSSLVVAIILSTVAVVWNYIFNTAFEWWEVRKQINKRTLAVRSVHALGFEGGLVLICLPLFMLWYDVGLWEAFTMEAALLVFFLVYTFVFTLLFDQIFTLHYQVKNEQSQNEQLKD